MNPYDEQHDGWVQCAGCKRVVMRAHVGDDGRCVGCPAAPAAAPVDASGAIAPDAGMATADAAAPGVGDSGASGDVAPRPGRRARR